LACFLATTLAGGKGVINAGDANFKKIVLDSGKASLVKFLAPW